VVHDNFPLLIVNEVRPPEFKIDHVASTKTSEVQLAE
jgi:hypothetical protein